MNMRRLSHPQGVLDIMNKKMFASNKCNNTALFEQFPYFVIATGCTAKEDPDALPSVLAHDLFEHLRTGAIHRCHSVDVENDVSITVLWANARKGWVRPPGSVAFHPAQSAFQVARVGECQRLGYFYDQASLDELDLVGMILRINETVTVRDTAENLYTRARRMTHNLQ